jgi:S-adenosylmethionine synthetase
MVKMKGKYFFTSESVTEGHPDKVADQISDAILDAIIKKDKLGRVACECLVTTGMAFIAGEITTDCYVSIPNIVRNVLKRIGYDKPEYGFDYETCAVITTINEQSPDIALGVNRKGAGDQGLMFGYAVNETKELMPLPIMLAHKLVMRAAEVRHKKILPYLRPDGKSQVTIEYEDKVAKRVDAIVLSLQHDPDVDRETMIEDFKEQIIRKVIPEGFLDKNTKYYINPTGRFVIGGPMADTGLTGRKNIVDTYGGIGSHGGGCFSGKDPTKVDRSGSYMARYVAKNIVSAGLASAVEVQISYAIGIRHPVSVYINTYNTGKIPDATLTKIVTDTFDLEPYGMIDYLKLLRPIYEKTAAYGHFGRNLDEFTWEKTKEVDTLREKAGI